MKTINIVVRGFVQGVAFRYFVQSHAIKLGISGWVKNVDSDKVEIMASGDEKRLDEFQKKCRRGPVRARVDHFTVNEILSDQKFVGFRIVD